MSTAPLLKHVAFDELIEPVNKLCNPAWGWSVVTQWKATQAIHWLLFVWVVAFCSDEFSSADWLGYAVNNLVPLAVFAGLCVPMCISLIGFMPHKVAFVALGFNVVIPFVMIHFEAGAPFCFAYVSAIIMTFMYLAIHLGEASNPDKIMDWGSVLQVNLVSLFSALFYLWQFANKVPLGWHLRWTLMAISYWKDGLLGALAERMGKRAVHVPQSAGGEYRTYNLNDVQYIRVFFARVSIMLALFSMARMLEEKVCPMQEVQITGAYYWGDFNKTIPVCPF